MAEQLNTYGLVPRAGEWKLFEIDGWPLLVQATTNDNDDGWGIRYSTSLGGDIGVGEVSIWLGSTTAGEATIAAFDSAFAEIDEARARAGLQELLNRVGPVIARATPTKDTPQ